MLTAAAILLTFAVLGGLTVGIMHLGNAHVPLWAGLVHGAFAAAGLMALAWAVGVRQGWAGLASISLILLLLAAAGGIYMFLKHGKRRPIPKPLILGHGLTALTAYILLLIHLFTQHPQGTP